MKDDMHKRPGRKNYDSNHITRMINLAYTGDPEAAEGLFSLVHQELKAIAANLRRSHRKAPELMNTTVIVNEVWMRLHDYGQGYANRGHFFAVAAKAMRQLLVDEARKQATKKRGEGAVAVGIDNLSVADQAEWLLSLDQALNQLGDFNPRLRDTFQLRFFVGLTEKETAEALEVSQPTVRRDWLKAKTMLSLII